MKVLLTMLLQCWFIGHGVGALCISGVKAASGFSLTVARRRLWFRIWRVLLQWKLAGAASSSVHRENCRW